MFRRTCCGAALAVVVCFGIAQAQSLTEVAKKEKQRRSEQNDKKVREVDADELSAYDDGTAPPPEEIESGSEPSADRTTRSWPEIENPNRRPQEKKTTQKPAEEKTRPQPYRDPTLGPKYIEDHLYGEEKLRTARRQASDCRLKERASSARCKALDKKVEDLEKLLRERRRLR
jgi:hypothetical protein